MAFGSSPVASRLHRSMPNAAAKVRKLPSSNNGAAYACFDATSVHDASFASTRLAASATSAIHNQRSSGHAPLCGIHRAGAWLHRKK